ncbi:hypothetical protein BC567DRAFT_277689 [Phyllosticta citribraziliensis]
MAAAAAAAAAAVGNEQICHSPSAASSDDDDDEQGDSDALIATNKPSDTRSAATKHIPTHSAIAWLLVVLVVGNYNQPLHHRHWPSTPPMTPTAMPTLFQPADFRILHRYNLLAFGVPKQPGRNDTDEQVAACRHQVHAADRRLSKTWKGTHIATAGGHDTEQGRG